MNLLFRSRCNGDGRHGLVAQGIHAPHTGLITPSLGGDTPAVPVRARPYSIDKPLLTDGQWRIVFQVLFPGSKYTVATAHSRVNEIKKIAARPTAKSRIATINSPCSPPFGTGFVIMAAAGRTR
jgi:hypothetical protein